MRRAIHVTVAATAAVAAALSANPAAGAAPAAGPVTAGPISAGAVSAAPVEIVGTSTGFTAATRHAAGHVTFRARTSHPAGGLFVLLRLRPGIALGDLLDSLAMGVSDDRAESAAGGRAAQRQAVMYGSAVVQPDHPGSFTSLLRPGHYYLINYQDLFEGGAAQAGQRLRPLTITEDVSPAPPPAAAATAVMTLAHGRARFVVPGTLRAGAPLRLVNAMPQLGEAVIMPVRPGTTDEQVGAFFDAVNAGRWDVESPFTGPALNGASALSPGHTTVLGHSLRPGEYALVTWYPDVETIAMLAAEGQYALITVV